MLKLFGRVAQGDQDLSDVKLKLDKKLCGYFKSMMEESKNRPEKIMNILHQNENEYHVQKTFRYKCGCSREKMICNLHIYPQTDQFSLFKENQNSFNLTCEYSIRKYQFTQDDLFQNSNALN